MFKALCTRQIITEVFIWHQWYQKSHHGSLRYYSATISQPYTASALRNGRSGCTYLDLTLDVQLADDIPTAAEFQRVPQWYHRNIWTRRNCEVICKTASTVVLQTKSHALQRLPRTKGGSDSSERMIQHVYAVECNAPRHFFPAAPPERLLCRCLCTSTA